MIANGEPESAHLAEVLQTSHPNRANANLTCSLEHDFATPIDSIYYFRAPDGQLINLEGSSARVGSRVIFECTDSKAKSAFRECLSDGTWSEQNNAIICDKWRYWAAVIAAATSAFIILILLIYFTCSAYNKRKKRKYIARKERKRFITLQFRLKKVGSNFDYKSGVKFRLKKCGQISIKKVGSNFD